MIIRTCGLYLSYLKYKFQNLKNVSFKGFTVCFAFKDSSITFWGGEHVTTINSSAFSNLVGLYQRCIFVARHGGK